MSTLVISLLSGLATPVGAWLVLKLRDLTEKQLAVILGFAAGIMLTVVIQDLMPSALDAGGTAGLWGGIVCGVGLLYTLRLLFGRLLKHQAGYLQMGWFMMIAIALHDLPEGMAIGAGIEVNHVMGLLIAIAIALHNIPEGMSIATPLRMAGVPSKKIMLLCSLVGLATPIGSSAALIIFAISQRLIGWSLGLAAGAMAFVVARDVWPEAMNANRKLAFVGILLGYLTMVLVSIIEK